MKRASKRSSARCLARQLGALVGLSLAACGYGTRDEDLYEAHDDSALADEPDVEAPKSGIVVREWTFDRADDYQGWAIEYTQSRGVQSRRLREDSIVRVVQGEDEDGVLSLMAPIERSQESVQVSVKFPEPRDLTGTTIKARVRLIGERRHRGQSRGVVPFVKASFVDNLYLGGGWHNVDVGSRWTEVRMQMRRPVEGAPEDPEDPTKRVVEIGLQLASGDDDEADYTSGLELRVDRVWLELDDEQS